MRKSESEEPTLDPSDSVRKRIERVERQGSMLRRLTWAAIATFLALLGGMVYLVYTETHRASRTPAACPRSSAITVEPALLTAGP